MEQWKDIPGHEGRYQASDLGRIKSLPNRRRFTEIILKQQFNKKCQRFYVTLTTTDEFGHSQAQYQVHRLILLTFKGPCPVDMEGCHDDGVGTNNRISNLRWDTKKANEADKVTHGTSNAGARNGKARVTETQVREIRTRLKAGESEESIAMDYPLTKHGVKQIRLNQTWRHVV